MTGKQFFDHIFLCGIRKVSRHITLLSNLKKEKPAWWESYFEFWWGLSIKYVIPIGLVWLQLLGMRTDIDNGGYVPEDYPLGTQMIGVSFVIVGVLMTIIPIFICTTYEEFDYDVDKPIEEMNVGNVMGSGVTRGEREAMEKEAAKEAKKKAVEEEEEEENMPEVETEVAARAVADAVE
jgi:hypothetical protein